MGKTKASWAPRWERLMPGAGRPAAARDCGPAGQGSLHAGFPGQRSLGSRAPQGPTTRPPAWPPRAPGRARPRRGPLAVTSFLVSKTYGTFSKATSGGAGGPETRHPRAQREPRVSRPVCVDPTQACQTAPDPPVVVSGSYPALPTSRARRRLRGLV